MTYYWKTVFPKKAYSLHDRKNTYHLYSTPRDMDDLNSEQESERRLLHRYSLILSLLNPVYSKELTCCYLYSEYSTSPLFECTWFLHRFLCTPFHSTRKELLHQRAAERLVKHPTFIVRRCLKLCALSYIILLNIKVK